MRWTTSILLLCLIHNIKSQCIIDHSKDITWEKKLHKYLECQHNNDPPPTKNVTTVKMVMILKYFTYESDENLFHLQSSMVLRWKDERLKWTPSDYDGIKETNFWNNSMWRPSVLVEGVDYPTFTDLCYLTYSGYHACIRNEVDYAFCISKLSNWPFDIQTCVLEYTIDPMDKNVKLASRQRSTKQLDLPDFYNLEDDWIIIDYEHNTNDTKNVVEVKIVIERNTKGLVAIIVFPSALVTALMTACLLLDAKTVRLRLCCFCILCHFLILNNISREIPKHSEDTPTILLFYRSSLSMACVLTVFTIYLKSLRNRKSVPPYWVSSSQDWVMDKFGNYLYFRWRTDVEDGDVTSMDIWNNFAYILNTVCQFVYFVTYVILLVSYIPS